ncbi:hypothetical protein NL108_014510 [Boleophthalmus pectinirostris]|nr:hypothetical protein NL108_014510 [Boleophthalmus pectinirostris]
MILLRCFQFAQTCLVITGDFNVHVDNVCDKNGKELSVVLETFGLTQYVSEPTHNRGHTLDLLITKGVNISNVNVVDVALSDHFCVFFDRLLFPNHRLLLQLFEEDT